MTREYCVLGRVTGVPKPRLQGVVVQACLPETVDPVATATPAFDGRFELIFVPPVSNRGDDENLPVMLSIVDGFTILSEERCAARPRLGGDHPEIVLRLPPSRYLRARRLAPASDELTSFVPSAHLEAIDAAVVIAFGEADSEWFDVIERLRRPLPLLDALLNRSRRYLGGEIGEGPLLLELLGAVVERPPRRATSLGAGPGAAPTPASPRAGGPGGPEILPGLRHPCLFSPHHPVLIDFAVQRLAAELFADEEPEIFRPHREAVRFLVDQTAPLSLMHFAAQEVLAGGEQAVSQFVATMEAVRSSWDDVGPMVPISARSSDVGTVAGITLPPSRLYDLCRLEQLQRTADAAQCMRALLDGPRYGVDDIVNLTKGVSRRACAGDEVEIRGVNLGRRGTLSFGRRPLDPTEILAWTPDAIRFRVPDRADRRALSLCIDPEVDACQRLPIACRLADPAANDLSLEIVLDPSIARFEARGPTVVSLEDQRYEAEACTEIELIATIPYAERAVIATDDGETLWDSDFGPPRRIELGGEDAAVRLEHPRESRRYRLVVTSLCGSATADVAIEIYRAVHLSAPTETQVGASFELGVRISCPAESAVPVALNSSDVAALPVPSESIQIAVGSDRTTTSLVGATCSEVVLGGEAAGHRTGTTRVIVFDAPAITAITPDRVAACNEAVVEIRGDCFAPEPERNTVRLRRDADGSSLTVPVGGVTFANPENRGRDAVMVATLPGLLPGEWTVDLTSRGRESADFSLRVTPQPAIIEDLNASPRRITPCVANEVTVSWTVRNAARVEVRAGDAGTRTFDYEPSCGARRGDTRLTIEHGQQVELTADALGDGASVTQRITIEEVPVRQAEEVVLVNASGPANGWTYSHVLTVWVQAGSSFPRIEERELEPGDHVVITLEDCTLTTIVAVSHRWVDIHNFCNDDNLSPTQPAILSFAEFHKLTLPILGRDGAGFQTISIGGEYIQLACLDYPG